MLGSKAINCSFKLKLITWSKSIILEINQHFKIGSKPFEFFIFIFLQNL